MRISDGSSDVCASDLVFLLESGSDRIGALDFQTSATAYVPRGGGHATLEELLLSAEKVERNLPLTPELDAALHHGSSIGGAPARASDWREKSEEHTSEIQSLMRISYAVFCLKKNIKPKIT